MPKYETRAVLAGAYKTGVPATWLTHTVDAATGEPLCRRVKADSLADREAYEPHARPTCKTCWRKDPRRQSAGGFLLGSLLQI